MIEGTYGFVYCSGNGFGMGVFTIKGEQFIGVDSGGVNYDGTAKEQKDGSIALDVKLNVPSELETARNASQRPPHTRQFVTTLPPAFGDGKPQEISSVPGNVTVSSSRPATGGRPGEGNGALPERSERRRFNLVIVTPHEALRRPLESAEFTVDHNEITRAKVTPTKTKMFFPIRRRTIRPTHKI